MAEPMTVYVAIEVGDYDEGDMVVGVYATLEAAQRAHQFGDGKGGIEPWVESGTVTNGGIVENRYWTTRHSGNVNIESHEVRSDG